MPLTKEEINHCRDAFDSFDKDGSGTIDVMELKTTLTAITGQTPTDEELHLMIGLVDEDGSGEIHFAEFLKVIEQQKALRVAEEDDETDTIEAFMALGGNADKSGGISTDKLSLLTEEFGLEINVDNLNLKKTAEGTIDYKEFKTLLNS
mmetsp:Transcript_18699/g.22396  ORF Transcript_18699/g.22396 Transcript_18699/m.22396 type:complete len:149 (+) Transcript_18699:187-633(+)|eukprot:CAMPEP_0197848184 /NCGR_PEP_ID=MMETSP1438-20131217/7971_1 /TAXON_ID=1461541 /ORGANISM="Pterosperma sp., Strain CCMP1384" /LENGTH=148 /DNA_ID=CAMNT_0043460323 /DNA_START=187 /DNA_END=633 /DNA_ORIENTATION=-